ncbi:hypothetical protein [Pararhodonellum marinum]|uniref:hypothetical protein n=1 Tax=Pararhodonellum marinum TaxID=2755358 RepID=UPI00188FA003|nr:hypothetical protein [Pararhodonellum marinum]
MKLDSTISWIKEKDQWHLTYGEDHLISLGTPSNGFRPFTMEGRKFRIKPQGFWQNKWLITNDYGQHILNMKFGFWDSKGRIQFRDGAKFECRFHQNPNFMVSIKDLRYGEDLLTYSLITEKNGSIKKDLILHQKEAFTDKLLFLLTLGMCMTLHYHHDGMDLGTFLTLCTAG